MADDKKFIQKAISRPGDLTRCLKEKYGSKAFNEDGTIKKSFVAALLKNENTPPLRKSQINFFLNVLAKANK